jgi:hypothetical protein
MDQVPKPLTRSASEPSHDEAASTSSSSRLKAQASLEPLLGSSRLSRTSSRDPGFIFQRQKSNASSQSSAAFGTEGAARKLISEHLAMESERDDYAGLHASGPDSTLFEQVGATVPSTDDPSLCVDTPRMWTICILASIIGSSTNLLFSLRYPSVTLTPIIALLVAHPLGLSWDRTFKRPGDEQYDESSAASSPLASPLYQTSHPTSQLRPSYASLRPWTRSRLYLARGKWNSKEHTCVYVSSNVSFTFAFATDIIVEQVKFYHQEASFTYQVLLILSTQLIGYSIAGLLSTFLVKPISMIWPSNLVATSMFQTLHNNDDKPAGGWTISRWGFFVTVSTGSFLWYFLPGLLMPVLSYFNAITWIAPDNVIVANFVSSASVVALQATAHRTFNAVWSVIRPRHVPSDI